MVLCEFQDHALEAHGALTEPEVLGHLLDEQSFGWAGRPVLFVEVREEGVEFLPFFAPEDEVEGTESVTAGVLRRMRLSCVCLGAGGLFGVPAVRLLLC